MTNYEARVQFVRKLIGKTVEVRTLPGESPKDDPECHRYVPLPEYKIALWTFHEKDWIPVEKRLPEERVPVLVVVNFGHYRTQAVAHLLRGEKVYGVPPAWLAIVHTLPYEAVTHWKPLGSLPKE
jgi:hypothetical protein